MGTLIESYRQVVSQVKSINDRIQENEFEIKQMSNNTSVNIAARISKLEEQLEKIDDYLLRIKGFQELAKKNLDSQNVLTIEAPPGYRVNLNRLRNWAMMIDPMSSNDPYAQRVFVVAKCDECFLEKKKKEFKGRIEQLRLEQDTGTNEDIERLKNSVDALREELKQFAMSERVTEFSQQVVKENNKYWYKSTPTEFINRSEAADVISPGAYVAALPFDKEQKLWLKSAMGDYYDADGGRVLLPVEIDNTHEYVMSITCAPSKRKKLDQALQNFVLAILNGAPAGMRKVYILDGVRFSSVSIGSLRQLEGTFALERIPRNPEQLTALLEQIVSSFADTDETIEQSDSVSEYNATVDPEKRIPLLTILLFGWPTSFDSHDRDLVQRIMTNYERYGVSFITVRYRNEDKKDSTESNALPEYAMQNAIHVSMLQNETSILLADGVPQRFAWYTFRDELSSSFVESLKKNDTIKEVIGNEYLKRYSLTDIPSYIREYKKIELPFGIDAKDEVHSVSFENENFATYLVGASRSGKSTLLHTLIAGLIRNYHPDNVELWLADFKQLEFKRYINHLPPHVKYILLDESTELVFDLIDKLTEAMMERQKLFSRLGVQRIDQVNLIKLDKPLPVIFVILDEFSIMSQSIAESQIYKLRLQNILAKGAALGIKFLFSSQTFTTGIAGLTPTARAQIQQRIAMKGSKEEISETLELSTNLKTDQVRNWMDALPPHYALVKFRISADTLPQVKRYLVMYFRDYAPRDQMIEQISASMKPIEGYNPADIKTYMDKHPVLVDGNTYNAFDEKAFVAHIGSVKVSNGKDLSGDEVFVSFGTPRLMEQMKVSALSSETRENMLLIAHTAEQACETSIIISIIKSFKLQNSKVQIWAYEKNHLFRIYRQVFEALNIEMIIGIDKICEEICGLKKKLIAGQSDNKLIVLIGMDRISVDFDYIINTSSGQDVMTNYAESMERGRVKTETEQKQVDLINAFSKLWKPINLQLIEEGKSQEEIKKLKREKKIQFLQENNYTATQNVQEQVEKKEEPLVEKETVSSAYNAKADFEFVVKQGSRFGYHFLLPLNSFSDLKTTGLKLEYFRYKMAFQVSVDDSRSLFSSRVGSTLPEHICQFDDTLSRYSFRPYLHEGVEWDGWYIESGKVVSPYKDQDN